MITRIEASNITKSKKPTSFSDIEKEIISAAYFGLDYLECYSTDNDKELFDYFNNLGFDTRYTIFGTIYISWE